MKRDKQSVDKQFHLFCTLCYQLNRFDHSWAIRRNNAHISLDFLHAALYRNISDQALLQGFIKYYVMQHMSLHDFEKDIVTLETLGTAPGEKNKLYRSQITSDRLEGILENFYLNIFDKDQEDHY